MKIILIDKGEDSFGINGITVYNENLYRYLTSHQHEVYIFRFTNKKPKEKYIYQIPYYLAEKRSYILIPSEKTLKIIENYLTKIKPDLVYINAGISPLDFLLPSLCHNLKIPIAGVLHADFSGDSSLMQTIIKSLFIVSLPFCKQLDLLHVFSHTLKQFFIRKGLSKNKICVIPNGVDTTYYKPGESTFAKQYKIKMGILFLGRITFQKNPEILIKSFLHINPSKDTKLVFVGTGELEKDLYKRYRDERIIFTGLVKEDKKKLDIIRACQIFVLPSRYEGMSLALLEAMSSGLACVVSDVGTNRELIDQSGILISEPNLKQLSLVLSLLIQFPEFARLLGQKARKKILKEYDQKVNFYHLTKKFQNTIENYKKFKDYQTQPLSLDRMIVDKLKLIWQKARKAGINISN